MVFVLRNILPFVLIFKNENGFFLKMKKIDYEQLIRQLSLTYEQKGRIHHDEVLDSLKDTIPKTNYDILKKVVLLDYIEKRDANTRIFGAFPERDIRFLAVKCKNLENSINTVLL
jgi:hypothetical protein